MVWVHLSLSTPPTPFDLLLQPSGSLGSHSFFQLPQPAPISGGGQWCAAHRAEGTHSWRAFGYLGPCMVVAALQQHKCHLLCDTEEVDSAAEPHCTLHPCRHGACVMWHFCTAWTWNTLEAVWCGVEAGFMWCIGGPHGEHGGSLCGMSGAMWCSGGEGGSYMIWHAAHMTCRLNICTFA